jgi:hypothetical protein
MATILDQRPVGDGYDVRILTGGEAHVLHFTAQPDEQTLTETVRGFELQLLAQTNAAASLEQEG